jgi:hypothetical protein
MPRILADESSFIVVVVVVVAVIETSPSSNHDNDNDRCAALTIADHDSSL